ncbi:ASCH domain-containing protein [Methanoculleus sp.]|uniref:ASCH domain-containing protein n=1 Tax=Methanoculleus sp. TaxID=90427 RepID=UPI00262A1674|nr:ASCH domain-containing protein [Methanoculleus sp.]MDI6867121.1 hypothetical protein [Methanoculleus sp.]
MNGSRLMEESMRVLLSIKPEYADKILCGSKRCEFRKTIFKNKGIREIVIYSSSPVKKIVGTCVIGSITEDHPLNLRERFRDVSGLCEEEYSSYFSGKERGDTPLKLEVSINSIDPWTHGNSTKILFRLNPSSTSLIHFIQRYAISRKDHVGTDVNAGPISHQNDHTKNRMR